MTLAGLMRLAALIVAFVTLVPGPSLAQTPDRHEGPIIDVHLHAMPFDTLGPPPLGHCPHDPELP